MVLNPVGPPHAGCSLPWLHSSGAGGECGEAEYREYLRLYEETASMSPNVISGTTGCLPSCERGEFEATVVDSMAYDMGVQGERLLRLHLFFPRHVGIPKCC